MGGETLEVVRAVYEATARGDTSAVLSLYDSAVEYDFSRSPFNEVLQRPIYRGHAGLRDFFQERQQDLGTATDRCEELIDQGDQVISVVVSSGRGRASGAEVARTHYGVWTVRDGKVVRVAWFGNYADACAAAGLDE